MIKEMIITRIKNDGSRVKFYNDESSFHVVANFDRAIGIVEGDRIEYEEINPRFGSFVRKINGDD